jgi:hypothetical protein
LGMPKRFLRVIQESFRVDFTPYAFDDESGLGVLRDSGPFVFQNFVQVIDNGLVAHNSSSEFGKVGKRNSSATIQRGQYRYVNAVQRAKTELSRLKVAGTPG